MYEYYIYKKLADNLYSNIKFFNPNPEFQFTCHGKTYDLIAQNFLKS